MSEFSIKQILQNILVLNLDRDADRMKRMNDQASAINLTLTRVPGILGKSLPEDVLQKYGKYLNNPGVIGCSFSHRKAWQTILDNKWDYALILEDDVTFTDLLGKIANGEEVISIPTDWNIFYFGHSKNAWPRNACSRVPQPEYNMESKDGPKSINERVIKFSTLDESPMGTWAYAITSSTASWLLNNYKLTEPVDVFIVSDISQKVNSIYGVVPSLITHCYEFGSSTELILLPQNTRVFLIALVIIAVIILSPLRFRWKMMSFLFVSFITLYIFESRKLERFTRKRYNIVYGNLPGTYGEDYFDPFENIWSDKHMTDIRTLLGDLTEFCHNYKIKISPAYGSLLGWARTPKKVVPWDDDMDVWISQENKHDILSFLKTRPDIGYVLGTPDRFDIKIFWKNGENIEGRAWKWPFIDIYFYDIDGVVYPDSNTTYILPITPSDGMLNTFTDTFEGIEMDIPVKYDEILTRLYGPSWLDTCVSSSWCHRTEQSIDNRYKSKIKCKLL